MSDDFHRFLGIEPEVARQDTSRPAPDIPAANENQALTAHLAGFLWIVIGSFMALAVVLFMCCYFLAEGVEILLGLPVVIGALFGGSFVYVGVQTVRGEARDTLGNGLGSIGLGLLMGMCGLYALAVARAFHLLHGGGGGAPFIGLLIVAGGLVIAGALALACRQSYLAWRQTRRRPTGDEPAPGISTGETHVRRLPPLSGD